MLVYIRVFLASLTSILIIDEVHVYITLGNILNIKGFHESTGKIFVEKPSFVRVNCYFLTSADVYELYFFRPY